MLQSLVASQEPGNAVQRSVRLVAAPNVAQAKTQISVEQRIMKIVVEQLS